MTSKESCRQLPSIDTLLKRASLQTLIAERGRDVVRNQLREVLGTMREELQSLHQNGHSNDSKTTEALAIEAEQRLEQCFVKRRRALTQHVINATGVVLHTNLGRAPLSKAAIDRINQVAGGYCNLEFDLASGKRGQRGTGLEAMLCEMFGCEAAAVVNNCAAAVFLILNTLAEGGEVIVSRGELIEIGGSFRLPDVIAKSGARLREVGTTNRTRLSDFESAINENTRAILRSHTSNYRIVGFTERPTLADLAELAHKHSIPLFEDMGSGALIDLSSEGVKDEPIVQQSIKAGVSVLAFSGDKLFGGPQAGIILGEKDLIQRVKKNPLMRAFRLDKIIFAALEATAESYASSRALTEIPTLAKLHLSKDKIAKRARAFISRAKKINRHLQYELIEGDSVVGGGSAPESAIPTKLISLSCQQLSAVEIEERLRNHQTPIITRIIEDRVLIDLRTVARNEETDLLSALADLS